MDTTDITPRQRKKGGKLIPALCNVLGWLILLSVICSCGAITVPRFLGYEIYDIVSGSMAPALPVGSIVYVQPTEPEVVEADDIIAFQSGDSVIVHRVVNNQIVEGKFITKGDANDDVDISPISYDALIGRVCLHCPMLGALMTICAGTIGKIYMLIFAACGVMLNMLAGRLRANR